MLEPATLAIIGATVVAWAASHLVGIGQFVDVVLLAVGAASLAFSAFDGAREPLAFATTVVGPRTEADLERAGRHLAQAATILGISTVQAVLFRGGARAIRSRGVPRLQRMERVGTPPPPGNQLRVSRPATLNSLGVTDEYGAIQVSRDQALSEQRLTSLHELVHRCFRRGRGRFAAFAPRT